MKLLIQPGDGIKPLIKAIRKAKKSVEVVIFRFDMPELEQALVEAVDRGVFVHALIAFTNRGGEKGLRDLETTFLAKGVTVARTAGDLVRYHSKFVIVDRKELFLLAFNFTHLDVDHSRSFGIATRNTKLVQEAVKLFEADTKRQDYEAGNPKFIVSPSNSRKQLAQFIKGAKRELLIYDPKVSDREMLRLLLERANAGVQVRVVGKVAGDVLPSRQLADIRLHTRTIVRDRNEAFVGSQSLKKLELDDRREVGAIFGDSKIVSQIIKTFQHDWKAARPSKKSIKRRASQLPVRKVAKKLAKVARKSLPAMPIAKHVTKALRGKAMKKADRKMVERTVKIAVKQTLEDAVKEAAKEAVMTTVMAS